METPVEKFELGGDVVIGVAELGEGAWLAVPLTPCCGASGKGGGHGVVCRKCYRDVDPMYGDCAPLYSVPGGWPTERIIAGWTDAPVQEIADLVTLWRVKGMVSA
jgi:hypothetical protein